MLWLIRRLRLRWHNRFRVTAIVLVVTVSILVIVTLRGSPSEPVYDESQRSMWLKEAPPVDELLNPVDGGLNSVPPSDEKPGLLIDGSAPQLGPFLSPFVIQAEADFSKNTYLVKKPVGSVPFKNISVWDPTNELKAISSVDFSKCEYSKCNMTTNHNHSDAVIFMADKLVKADKLPDFQRKPGQYWVFRTMEAPSRFSYFVFLNKTGYKDHFNWTMSYRMDSDIPTPFGRLVEKYLTSFKDLDTIYAGKTKSVAFFTAYCEIRSKSLDFVKKMAEKIDVDIFGPCGTKQCTPAGPIDWDSTKHKKVENKDCFPMLSKMYKFYMVFENSICRDYVTDVFFQSFGDVDVVPVVRGGADYKGYFPTGSFIDASDYSSPGALADYLLEVGKDKDRYVQLLKTKQNYVGITDFPDWQCKLCEKLHTTNATRTYVDIHNWWTQIPCRDPGTDVPAL